MSGMMVRNARGEVLVLQSLQNNKIATPFTTKARACSQAMEMGLVVGADNIELEGYALTVIKNVIVKPLTNQKFVHTSEISIIIEEVIKKSFSTVFTVLPTRLFIK